MKKLYYRSQKISSKSLLFLASFAVVVVTAIRCLPSRWEALEQIVRTHWNVPDLEDRMLEAAYRADSAFETIHCHRVKMGHPLLDIHDPADTGMLGPSMSLVTTLPGHLDAKQTSINPNFAAVATRLLVDAGVRPGDRIAIGCTGSFPALNIAVYSAAEALDLRPVIISSAASSQYGANSEDLMWPDMEKLLFEQGIFENRSLMISRGGFDDRAAGMNDATRAILEASIVRSERPLLDSENDSDAIEQRMLAYSTVAEDESFAAYINVGGGDASVGGTEGNQTIGKGLILPGKLAQIRKSSSPEIGSDNEEVENDCVATRFLASGVPVINMIHVVALASQYGLPVTPTQRAEVGQGSVYAIADPRRWLALLGIVLIVMATSLVVHPPFRAMELLRKRGWLGDATHAQPQWMV